MSLINANVAAPINAAVARERPVATTRSPYAERAQQTADIDQSN